MMGVFAAMAVILSSAAAVLTMLARRNSPEGGWREVLGAGVHAVRSRELPLVDHSDPDDEGPGGLDDLFEVAETDDGPAYSEAKAVRNVLHEARQRVHRLAHR